jgi:putative nucleotidyltransferase with HDIG domain
LYFSDFADLEKEFTASEKAFFDTIKILIQLLDSKDRYTWEHSRQVAYYAVQLAESLGLSEEEKYWLRLTGYLHDIGKIHISSEIMNKKGRLNPDEFSVVMLHPIVGANLLAPIKGFKRMIPIIYHHHEWFDGSGYPDGLSGYDIPKGARILAVIDGFDAMTSNRPYRKAQAIEWALDELVHQKGTQYDPQLVDAFVKLIRRDLAKEVQKNRRQTDRLNHGKERRAGKEAVKESN